MERSEGWTGDFARRTETKVSRLDFKTKPLDPSLRVKELGAVKRENELRSERREAYLLDIQRVSSFKI